MVDVSVRVGIDGGSWEDDEVVRTVGWIDGAGRVLGAGPQPVRPGQVRQYAYEARGDLAIDVDTRLVEI
jgi:hypothetical protein